MSIYLVQIYILYTFGMGGVSSPGVGGSNPSHHRQAVRSPLILKSFSFHFTLHEKRRRHCNSIPIELDICQTICNDWWRLQL